MPSARGPKLTSSRTVRAKSCWSACWNTDPTRHASCSGTQSRVFHSPTHTVPSPGRSSPAMRRTTRSEEHTSELQSQSNLVCRLLLEKKNVTATYAPLRIWRNTAIAALAPGTSYTFPVGTLGMEWDQEVDNGVRPAVLSDLSRTVVDV